MLPDLSRSNLRKMACEPNTPPKKGVTREDRDPQNLPTAPQNVPPPPPRTHQVVADSVPQHVELHQSQLPVAVFLQGGRGLRKAGEFGGSSWGCPPSPKNAPPIAVVVEEDTSMRLTMLRQDSVLKPLVRRSLSAKNPVVICINE